MQLEKERVARFIVNLTAPQKLIAVGKFDEAERLLPAFGQSRDPRVDLLRGRMELDKGEIESSIETLSKVVQRFPDYAPGYIFLGISLIENGQWSDAEVAFDRALRLQSSNDLARSYKGLTLLAQSRNEAAAQLWRQHRFSDNTMFRVRLTEFVETEWLKSKAFLGESASAVAVTPVEISVRKALSRFYKRDFRGVLDFLPLPPTDNEIMVFLASTSYWLLRQYPMAETYLDSLRSKVNEWPDPLTALNARLLTRQGKLTEAAQEFSKVLIVGPEDYGTNYYLGVICLAFEKKQEARQYFLRSYTSYMIDTYEFQWWQIEQALISKQD